MADPMTAVEEFNTEADVINVARGERDRLVRSHLDLAHSLARRFIGRGEELDDLRQVALLALVRAADRFDASRRFAFSTFAMPTIIGAFKRHLRDHGWVVRPPRSLQERYLDVAAVTEFLTGELGHFPTTAEIAARGVWSDPQVEEARVQQSSRLVEHWDAGEPGGSREPGVIDHDFERVETRDVVDDLLARLEDRERQIVEMRFFGDLGQADIGRRVGVSQMHVCRLLKTSLSILRLVTPSSEAAFEGASCT
jgi:RNA polymerase sigma-B factor